MDLNLANLATGSKIAKLTHEARISSGWFQIGLQLLKAKSLNKGVAKPSLSKIAKLKCS